MPKAFEAELALDELEARLGPEVDAHALASWNRHMHGNPAVPLWPSDIDAERLCDRLHGWRGALTGRLRVRLHVMWSLLVTARVEGRVSAQLHGVAVTHRLPVAVRERNAAARRLGFEDYVGLACAMDGVSPSWLEDRIMAPSPPFPERDAAADERDDPLEVLAARLGDRELTARGRLALSTVLPSTGLRVDHVPGLTARTYLVDPPRDVRIVCAPPSSGGGALRSLWHELGHAGMAAGRGAGAPWASRQPRSRLLDELGAELAANHLVSETVLAGGFGLSSSEVQRVQQTRARRRGRWLRRQRARARLEWTRYRDPDVDAGRTWRQLCDELGLGAEMSDASDDALNADPGAQWRYLIAATAADDCRVSAPVAIETLAGQGPHEWSQSATTLARARD